MKAKDLDQLLDSLYQIGLLLDAVQEDVSSDAKCRYVRLASEHLNKALSNL